MYKDVEVETVRRYLYCDECGELMTMNNMGLVYATNPYQYPHTCVNGHQKNELTVYPLIVHREKNV